MGRNLLEGEVADLTTQLPAGVPLDQVGTRPAMTPLSGAPELRLARSDLDDLLRGLTAGIIVLTADGHITLREPTHPGHARLRPRAPHRSTTPCVPSSR